MKKANLVSSSVLGTAYVHSPTQGTQLPSPSEKARALGLSRQQLLLSSTNPRSSPGRSSQLALALHVGRN